MSKRISEDIREKIRILYDDGKGSTLPEIVRQTEVSYSSVYCLTRAKKRGFTSRADYDEYLTKKRGFASLTDYRRYLAKERQQKPINQRLSNLIQQRLIELDQS